MDNEWGQFMLYIYHNLLTGLYIDGYTSLRNLIGKNIDRQHLRPPVLAILLETIEREIFDALLLA